MVAVIRAGSRRPASLNETSRKNGRRLAYHHLSKVVDLIWSVVGVAHEAARYPSAVSGIVARDKPGDVFLKVDADQARIDVEGEAMSLAPVPTPAVLWRKPSVLASAALPGTTLARLGGPSTGSSAAWAASARPVQARPPRA